MRPPPPLSELPFFPVTGGIVLLAIVATGALMLHYSIEPLELNYLAFHGQPWRLVTSALPHDGIIHIFFDAYWMWILGAVVEERFGHVRAGLLFAFLAAASGAAQYAFDAGGIGLSGIVYGLFGFLWVAGRYDRRVHDVLDKQTTQLFVFWFFLCVVLTAIGWWNIANIAHGAGAVFGAIIAWAIQPGSDGLPSRTRVPATTGLVVLSAICFWAATAGRPLVNYSRDSDSDLLNLGYEALMHDQNEKAAHYLEIATSMRHPQHGSWFDLGIAYERLGKLKESETAFAKAAQVTETTKSAHTMKIHTP
jgi:GlpG protein